MGLLFCQNLSLTHTLRNTTLQFFHPLLEIPVNRWILARHLFVDTFSCVVLSLLGWWNRHLSLEPMYRAILGGSSKAPCMTKDGYERRLFGFDQASCRIGVFFLAYQIKNTIDAVLWNDGAVYIFHHIMAMIGAFGSVHPQVASYYASFFLGLSEISTAILCVFANFQDVGGVVGLGDAFPLTKVVVGCVFVASFVVCRCIMWPIASYYFVRDAFWALGDNSPLVKGRRTWILVFVFCLIGLSVLQITWLGEILTIGYQELKAVGIF